MQVGTLMGMCGIKHSFGFTEAEGGAGSTGVKKKKDCESSHPPRLPIRRVYKRYVF